MWLQRFSCVENSRKQASHWHTKVTEPDGGLSAGTGVAVETTRVAVGCKVVARAVAAAAAAAAEESTASVERNREKLLIVAPDLWRNLMSAIEALDGEIIDTVEDEDDDGVEKSGGRLLGGEWRRWNGSHWTRWWYEVD